MKNIKLYDLEETYHGEKSSFEFPTVSYTIDTDKVWYMKNNQIKMMFSITEDDVNNYNGEDLMVWGNSVLFDSVKVDGVEQKVPLQEKNVIITGETSEEVIVDITLENSVTQGEVVIPQPMSMTIEEDGTSSSELPYIINITDENKLPFSSGKITVKLTNTSLNILSYHPSFYVRYTSTIEENSMAKRTEYALLDWYTAQDSFGMVVSDDGTEMTLTLPSEVNITHLFIVPMDSQMVGSAVPLEPEVEGIYLDENHLLYSYETNNIILPCQLICGGEFIFDESCYINDQNIKKYDLIFNEPISEDKVIDMDKYFFTMLFQGYNDGMWINYENFTLPLSFLIEEGMTDGFIVNEKSELVGLDLYYCSGELVNYLGPTVRMLAHVVYDGNAIYDEENENFIVNVNEETLVGSYINMIIGGMPLLSLPTTEVKNYEVVATKYNDVTDMSNMFYGCNRLTSLDLSNFDTSKVTTMSDMFSSCKSLTSVTFGDNFDTSKVTNMSYMFCYCSGLTSLDVSNFNTSAVTDMSYMFSYCDGLTSVTFGDNFDTSKATNMQSMFNGCSGLTSLDLSNFNTSHVTTMEHMFLGCRGLTSLDLSNFNTSNVSNMQSMFNGCSGLTSLDLSNFNTSNVTSMSLMFQNCGGLTSLNVSNFNTSNVTNMNQMFNNCISLTSLDLSNFNTSNVTGMSWMFHNCENLMSLTLTSDISHIPTNQLKYAFSGVSSSLTIYHASVCDNAWYIGQRTSPTLKNATFVPALNLNIETITSTISPTSTTTSYKLIDNFYGTLGQIVTMKINGSAITPTSKYTFSEIGDYTIEYSFLKEDSIVCQNMFSGCSSLTSIDFGNFDTSKVTNMSDMFTNCSGLKTLNISNFNTSNVTKMEDMFANCSGLTSLDLSNFNTSNVTKMSGMFYNCRGLTSLDVSNFNTSNVTDMSLMFYQCSGLTSLDLSNFDTSKVTNMSDMFVNYFSLTSVTFGSQADVSKVTSYNSMFEGITTTGTLYYPSAYADSWNKLLVTQQSSTKFPSTWTAVPIDYENGETVPTV